MRTLPRRTLTCAATVLLLSIGAASAQSLNKTADPKQTSPGATGALGNVNANGIATDPEGVKQQQGNAGKSAPGTVGAAPGANPPSNQSN